MKVTIEGHYCGKHKGEFKDSEGKKIRFNQILLVEKEETKGYLVATVDKDINIDSLERFAPYVFDVEISTSQDGKAKYKIIDIVDMDGMSYLA